MIVDKKFSFLKSVILTPQKYLKLKGGVFFLVVDFPLLTKVVGGRSNCRIDMRVGALESL